MKKIILSAIAVLGLSAATTELPSFDDTTVVLHKGWNLVGSDSAVNLVKDLNNSAIKIAWRWHNGNWEAFSLNKDLKDTITKEGYTYFTQTAPHEGFWVYANDFTTISIGNGNQSVSGDNGYSNSGYKLPLVDTPMDFNLSDVANKTFKIIKANFKISFDENGNGTLIGENNSSIGEAIFDNGVIKINIQNDTNQSFNVQKIASSESGVIILSNVMNNGNIESQFLDAWISKENPVDMSTLNYPTTFYLDYPGEKIVINDDGTMQAWGKDNNYTIENGQIVVKGYDNSDGNYTSYYVDKLQIVDTIGRYDVIKDEMSWTDGYKDDELVDKTFDDIKDSNISVNGYYLHSDNTITTDYNSDENITYNEINSTAISINICYGDDCKYENITINPDNGLVSVTNIYNEYLITSTSPIFKETNQTNGELQRKKITTFKDYLKRKYYK